MQLSYYVYSFIYFTIQIINLIIGKVIPLPYENVGVSMKLNFIEDEPKSLIIEFGEADRGIAELIKDKLLNKEGIEFATVVKEHPDISNPRLVVKSSKNARALVSKAISEVEEEIKELASEIPKK